MSVVGQKAMAMLDAAHEKLLSGKAREGMQELMPALRQLKQSEDPVAWDEFCRREFLEHPLKQLIWQDPFTRHAFEKPRGYPGDAGLLDYIYDCAPPPDTTELGREIFRSTTEAPASCSVRARRDVLAKIIDDVAAEVPGARMLSIACGHLREAALSRAINEDRVSDFIAADQDPTSLAEVQARFGHKGVRTVQASVRGILAEKVKFQGLHLAYAAGLYDYLADRVAAKLTRLMFDMLAPGGRLLVANFAPNLRDIGYMETYMGWNLIYRTPDQMNALAGDIPVDAFSERRVFWDEPGNILFLEVRKRVGARAAVAEAVPAKTA